MTDGRPRTARCTIVAEARVLARTPLAWLLLVGAAPVVITLGRGGSDLRGAALACALVGAGTVGVAIDEAGGAVVEGSPVWAGWRRAIRLPMVVLAVMGVWALGATWALLAGVDLDDLEGLAWPTAAIACATVAAALVLPGTDTGVAACWPNGGGSSRRWCAVEGAGRGSLL
jgi:hypothetical protein